VSPNRIEPVVLLLAFLMMVFTGCLFLSNKMFPMDGQMFQVIAGLLTGIAGAFMMRVKPKQDTTDTTTTSTVKGNPPAATITETSVTQ
jgi:hypothetical protein